jgi:hypothetical protein
MKSATTPTQALAAALALEIPESRIASVLSDAMAADIVNRDGSRSPDHRTRLAATETVLTRIFGVPVRREESLVVTVDTENSEKLEERLLRSPALRHSLAVTLAKVEGEGRPPVIEA